ncbi:hypothetical protein ACFJIS_21275 [Variovorax boronicumulans]|uniref:hypothetical protein n=1 Tax=Variovorax boronicumulans TaxID=436515 RepID=UPI0036F20E4D
MWKSSDIDVTKNYQLLLVQSSTGMRSFVLHDETEPRASEGLFAATDLVSNELLQKRNLHAIARTVALTGGEPFYVDAHGTWLTKDEMDAILEDKDDDEIPWLNSLPPRLAPR